MIIASSKPGTESEMKWEDGKRREGRKGVDEGEREEVKGQRRANMPGRQATDHAEDWERVVEVLRPQTSCISVGSRGRAWQGRAGHGRAEQGHR